MNRPEVEPRVKILIYVPDVQSALRFYCGVLDSELPGDVGDDHWAQISLSGDGDVCLALHRRPDPPAPAATATGLSISVQDLGEISRLVESIGGTVVGGPEALDDAGTYLMDVADPWGNLFMLCGPLGGE